jgi:hypothetical protein
MVSVRVASKVNCWHSKLNPKFMEMVLVIIVNFQCVTIVQSTLMIEDSLYGLQIFLQGALTFKLWMWSSILTSQKPQRRIFTEYVPWVLWNCSNISSELEILWNLLLMLFSSGWSGNVLNLFLEVLRAESYVGSYAWFFLTRVTGGAIWKVWPSWTGSESDHLWRPF